MATRDASACVKVAVNIQQPRSRVIGVNVCQSFASLHVIREYGVALPMSAGPSMMPALNSHGDIVVLNRSMQARFSSCRLRTRLTLHFPSAAVSQLESRRRHHAIDSNPKHPNTIIYKRIIPNGPCPQKKSNPACSHPPLHPFHNYVCLRRQHSNPKMDQTY